MQKLILSVLPFVALAMKQETATSVLPEPLMDAVAVPEPLMDAVAEKDIFADVLYSDYGVEWTDEWESEVFNEETGEWESAGADVENVLVGGDWESMGYYDENGEWVFGVEPEHEETDWEAYAYGEEEDEGSDLDYEDFEYLSSLIFEGINDALEYHTGDLHAMHDIFRFSAGWALLPLETDLNLLHEAIDQCFPN